MSIADDQLFVRNLISDRHLFLMGCYAQTCAHIEQRMWEYFYFERHNEEDKRFNRESIVKLRGNTQKLIDEIKRHSLDVTDPDEKSMIESIICDVEMGLSTRNGYLHGAFTSIDGNKYLQIKYLKAGAGAEESTEVRPNVVIGQVDPAEFEIALANANSILNRAIVLCDRARTRREMPVSGKDTPTERVEQA